MSYLDVLTLLITLFVLLLSLAPQDNTLVPNEQSGGGEQAQSAGPGSNPASTTIGADDSAGGDPKPGQQDILPLNDGLQPLEAATPFEDLDVEGVSMAKGTEGITLRIDNNLLFASGQATLTETGAEVIKGLVPTLEQFNGEVSVEGHTDDIPISTVQFPSNWELSTARATAVVRYLIEAGMAKDRMRAIGYADTRPLEDNETPEGRAANRRVELLVKETP
jgi:chemotaxis protein MotB